MGMPNMKRLVVPTIFWFNACKHFRIMHFLSTRNIHYFLEFHQIRSVFFSRFDDLCFDWSS